MKSEGVVPGTRDSALAELTMCIAARVAATPFFASSMAFFSASLTATEINTDAADADAADAAGAGGAADAADAGGTGGAADAADAAGAAAAIIACRAALNTASAASTFLRHVMYTRVDSDRLRRNCHAGINISAACV